MPFSILNRGGTHKNKTCLSVASGRGGKDGMAPCLFSVYAGKGHMLEVDTDIEVESKVAVVGGSPHHLPW